MHYFYREMDFRETEKPTLVLCLCVHTHFQSVRKITLRLLHKQATVQSQCKYFLVTSPDLLGSSYQSRSVGDPLILGKSDGSVAT